MSVNVTDYESSLQTQLDNTSGSTSATDMLLLAKAVDALNTGAIISVATTGDLPAAADNTGRIIYVTAQDALYYANADAGAETWVSLSTTLSALGVTASAAELNILDGATLTTAELNTLDGITANVTELNYVDGVTSNVQTQLDGKLDLSGGTMTGALTLSGAPTSNLHSATKAYVDEVAQGVALKPSVLAATTANLSGTYDNGTAGVGATLTIAAAASLTIDGVTFDTQYQGLLIKDQTNAEENGRYYLSQVGDAGTTWIFTRCQYCDESDEIAGGYIFVQDGTANASTGWVMTVADAETFTVGTDDITVIQFSGAGTYSAGTGLTLTGTEFSLTSPISGTYDALHPTVSTITTAIDFDNAVNKLAMSAATTFTESNKAEGRSTLFKLDTSASAYTPTFSANIQWASDTEPTWADYRYWVISLVCNDSTNVFGTATGHTI